MSMKYIRDTYGVPAKRGREVTVWKQNGEWWELVMRGQITGSRAQYLYINKFGPYHPRYGIVYYDDDGVELLDTRKDDQ